MADVLSRTVRLYVKLTENELVTGQYEYLDQNRTFTESVHNRAVLSTNMLVFEELDISSVDTPALLYLECDRSINVAVNTSANVVTLGSIGYIAMVATFTRVFVQNENTTFTATIEFVVTD